MDSLFIQISSQMETNDKNIESFLKKLELLEDEIQPERDDLFYLSDPSRWSVEIEGRKLPKNGMIIQGENTFGHWRKITWAIKPAD